MAERVARGGAGQSIGRRYELGRARGSDARAFSRAVLGMAVLAVVGAAGMARGDADDYRKGAQDPFAENVRSTPALSPEAEGKSFHLPAGFSINLVTSEPDIQKPMNLAFDEKGRLWVTDTREYPFPADPGKGHDTIKVIEIGRDGRATKVSTFATKLNIPIGIYPWRGGAIAYSIPKISMHWDDNLDGKADRVEGYYGDFGYREDTHGMTASFTRGFDGWLYATHGFKNTSHVSARDGSKMDLNSGNTYRMAVDGSHVEQWTWGQTNPFGLTWDEMGNLYSSDSHSKPLMELEREGHYMGIGKDEDGLGFAPLMMEHTHQSTAIAGATWYGGQMWPKEYFGRMYVGNVVTSRINQDTISFHGSSPWAHEEKDFLTTDDPWFRPVNMTVGPDGALYVADFYNKIIGHYEVPLDHPGRDHFHGRIWRISYGGAPADLGQDWGKASLQEMLAGLDQINLPNRMRIMNLIYDRFGKYAGSAVYGMVRDSASSPAQRICGLWLLQRLGVLDSATISTFAAAPNAGVRVHVMRILGERPQWNSADEAWAVAGLSDADALVRRCAADALGRHSPGKYVDVLMAFVPTVDPKDTQLLYVARRALRDQLAAPGAIARLGDSLTPAQVKEVGDVAVAIPTEESSLFLLKHLDAVVGSDERVASVLGAAVKSAPPADLDRAVGYIRDRYKADLDRQFALFRAVMDGVKTRGMEPSGVVRSWGEELITTALKPGVGEFDNGWRAEGDERSWSLQQRRSNDGKTAGFVSSLPVETMTGRAVSPSFVVPSKMSLWMAGHRGTPPGKATEKNFVAVVDDGDGKELTRAYPPRNDVARRHELDLSKWAGTKAHLEVVDGDDGSAYAWLAVGRIEPAGLVAMPTEAPGGGDTRVASAAEVAGELDVTGAAPWLTAVLDRRSGGPDGMGAAAAALVKIDEGAAVPVLAKIVQDTRERPAVRERVAAALGDAKSPAARVALVTAYKAAPARVQTGLSRALVQTRDGGEALLAAVADGRAPARALQPIHVRQGMVRTGVPDAEKRIAALTKGMPTAQDQIDKLIDQRKKVYQAGRFSAVRGKEIFAKNCMVCHQIDGEGKVVGPQLDGIGNRGVDRVMEDVLDPNRNVDPAFRYLSVTLKDGRSFSGLQKKVEGDAVTFADSTGKEVVVKQGEITEKLQSKLSLMPSNFSEIIPEKQFDDLMAFLLSHKAQGK